MSPWEHTHTHITSPAMAVPSPKSTAILLIVTYLSLSTPFITTPHTVLPLFLELPSQKASTNFRVSALSLQTTIFFYVLLSPDWPSDQLPDLVPGNVLNVILNPRDGNCDLPSPPRVQCFLNLTNFPRNLSQGLLAMDRLPCHSTVGPSSCVWMFVFRKPQDFWCLNICMFF